jgi:BirA family transcriptional regulator, biotin operon repressor / biotin---[acetyl-CoA-carboxylase] ligase
LFEKMSLDIEFVRKQLPGRDLHYFESIDTTMREAAVLAARGWESGTAVIAEEQTAGQGRHGHSWHSEKGLGLYVSILLQPDLKWESAPTLTVALGLATAEAITTTTGLACDLRWPNDIMIGGKKAAGILAQLIEPAAVAGIGINVNHEQLPAELAEEATSLRQESGREQSREQLLIELLPAIDRYVSLLAERGPDPILDLFSRRSSYASGKRVTVQQGDSVFSGTTAGLNDAGFLVVRKDDGSDEIILAGGVRAVGSGRR